MTRSADAVILCLCSAFLAGIDERARARKDGALANRIGRALVQLEAAHSLIPATAVTYDTHRLAAEFYDLMAMRLSGLLVAGDWQRGEEDLDLFGVDILARLNDPRNVAKGDYREMSLQSISEKTIEEAQELVAELWQMHWGKSEPAKVKHEAADLAAVALFAWCAAEKAEKIAAEAPREEQAAEESG